MADTLRVSKKNYVLPTVSLSDWKIELRPGGWAVARYKGGKSIRLMLFESRGRVSISLRGFLWGGEWVRKERNASGAAAGDLTAQFPGKIRKILVKKGAKVTEGEALLLMEAMKMEFTIQAPCSGLIQDVLVQEGQQVSPGDLFLDFVTQTTADPKTDSSGTDS